MVPKVGVELETNEVEELSVFRTTSENTTKRLEICVITNVGKFAQALIMKQIATKECHVCGEREDEGIERKHYARTSE